MKKPKKRHTNIMPEGINRRDIPFLKTKPMASKFKVIIERLGIRELRD
ncbi:MAG: hypothetical protein U9Q89_07785 [Thermodesulfobacteriota bacterium]|nr:hypothetical protein [Thermodesulfobacteriota bacterium]